MSGTAAPTMTKPKKPAPQDEPEPTPDPTARRMVGIPGLWAAALEEIAAVEMNTLTEQVKTAVREYLERKGKLPKPPQQKR